MLGLRTKSSGKNALVKMFLLAMPENHCGAGRFRPMVGFVRCCIRTRELANYALRVAAYTVASWPRLR